MKKLPKPPTIPEGARVRLGTGTVLKDVHRLSKTGHRYRGTVVEVPASLGHFVGEVTIFHAAALDQILQENA